MSAYLLMLRRDFISVKNPELEIKRVIGTVHATGEEDYMRVAGPEVLGYTVSQRSLDLLKIAYVGMPPIKFGYYATSSDNNGITILRISLPTDESKIDWNPLSQPNNRIDCNVPERIMQEFGIDIAPHLKVRKSEDNKIDIKSRHWGAFPEGYFLGR